MSKHFTVHNGQIHFSLDAAKSFGEMAADKKIATIANTLRIQDASLELNACRAIAKQMIRNPGHTSYKLEG